MGLAAESLAQAMGVPEYEYVINEDRGIDELNRLVAGAALYDTVHDVPDDIDVATDTLTLLGQYAERIGDRSDSSRVKDKARLALVIGKLVDGLGGGQLKIVKVEDADE
jgi:hypothetical protein